MQSERYDSCSRILALVLAALRWSGSELRADPALFEALERVLKPSIGMQHLTEHIEQDALQALLLFGSMDVATAKEHWQFMTQLVRKLGADARTSRARQHAEVALSALGDCVRLHAQDSLDDLELLDAVRAVAVVPRGARALVPEAFCGMLLHAGTALLGAHLRSPVVELQWALAWVLVEAFAQPSTEEEHVADELTPRTRLRVLNFFATLPRVLGDHGSALLVISVEAVAASGLWRRAVLLPPKEGGRTRWTHDFSWPRLFRFVTKVVDTAQLRLRLGAARCSSASPTQSSRRPLKCRSPFSRRRRRMLLQRSQPCWTRPSPWGPAARISTGCARSLGWSRWLGPTSASASCRGRRRRRLSAPSTRSSASFSWTSPRGCPH